MAREVGNIEQFFHQIKVDKLPGGRKPKYKVGDLVEICFRSDDGTSSYLMKGDYGLVCEVILYSCIDYDEVKKDNDPHYLIEYKLLISKNRNEFRYVQEENLRKVNK